MRSSWLFGVLMAVPLGACTVDVGGLGPAASDGLATGAAVPNAGSGVPPFVSEATANPGAGGSSPGGLQGGGVAPGVPPDPVTDDAGGVSPPSSSADAGALGSTGNPADAILVVTSPDFGEGDRLPNQFTCSGSNRSPAFEWRGVPQGTQSFALVLTTPTNVLGSVVDYTRWAIWNIPAGRLSLPAMLSEGMGPTEVSEADQVSNESDLGTGGFFGAGGDANAGRRYRGPCSRGFPQTFSFTLYALGPSPGYPLEWRKSVTPDAVVSWLHTTADVLGQASINGISP